MIDRRTFLTAGAAAALNACTWPRILAEASAVAASPQDLAGDETFWSRIQAAFTVDRSWTNLNAGGVSPTVTMAHEALKRHLDAANTGPSYVMWRLQEPNRDSVRAGLARAFGADPEEIAIVRNSSEGLQICQFGFDLQKGDEVLATNQDYPRMLNTFKQRERREGIVLRTFPIPVPLEDPAEIVRRYEANLTPKTKLILCCHVINLTGTILPVKEVVALGRSKGIPVIVDGAHAFAHFPFTHRDLDCDYYATSLHKWLFAPIGTGMLYVRRDKIAKLWPLMAAAVEQEADIRKFEETGTRPAAPALAIAESLAFHEGLGPERKAARLRHLRDRWARRLSTNSRVKLLTPMNPALSCAIGTFAVDGMEPAALQTYLWDKHRVFTTPIGHDDVKGVRVSPGVWTTLAEIDRFADAVERAIRDGVK